MSSDSFDQDVDNALSLANCIKFSDVARLGERVQIRRSPLGKWEDGEVVGLTLADIDVRVADDVCDTRTVNYVLAIWDGVLRRAKPSQILQDASRRRYA